MCPSFQLKNITLYFVSSVCSSFSRYYVCKQPSVFQAASFGDLLLNEKQKKPFVLLKDEVTITQWFLTAASLAQVDKVPNEADLNLCYRSTCNRCFEPKANVTMAAKKTYHPDPYSKNGNSITKTQRRFLKEEQKQNKNKRFHRPRIKPSSVTTKQIRISFVRCVIHLS